MARKPRDFDAELQALMARAKKVKTQKTTQLGELGQVVGADAPPSRHSPERCSPRSNSPRSSQRPLRGGPNADKRSFSKGPSGGNKPHPAILLRELQATAAQLQHLTVLRNRLDRGRARDDKRQWVQDRRARTRHLIELGGLLQKAGLVELLDDDRATLLGAFLELVARLREADDQHQGETAANLLARWRRRGLRAFDADTEPESTGQLGPPRTGAAGLQTP